MQTQVQFNKLRINVFANKNDFYCFLIRGNLFEKSLSPMSSLAYQINITSTLNIDSPSLARQYDFFYIYVRNVLIRSLSGLSSGVVVDNASSHFSA